MIYDYIILGAGPSGSTTAYCLQNIGARCIILEQRGAISEKTCGGLLTYSGIKMLRSVNIDCMELIDMGAVQFHCYQLYSKQSNVVKCYHHEEYGIGTTRKTLDTWILEKAINAGASVQFGKRVHGYSLDNDVYTVGSVKGRNIIVATGARGFCPEYQKYLLSKQSFGVSAKISGESKLSPDSVYFWYLNNLNEYCWCIPNGKNLWNIGVWFRVAKKCCRNIFYECFDKYISTSFHNYHFVQPLRGAFCGNVDLSSSLIGRCYGVGDFAGKNISTTGEGLRYAIQSALEITKHIQLNQNSSPP